MIPRFTIAIAVASSLVLASATLAFVLLPFRWPLPRATVFSGALEIADSPNDFQAAFERAADEWAQHTGFDINVAPDGVGACDTSGRLLNGAEFFPFDCGGFRLGDRVLAVTETLIALDEIEGEDGEIRAVGITFNSEVDWGLYDGPWRRDAADFERVALHEQGHVIGLDHEDELETPTIMRSLAGDTNAIQQDDIDGVRERYPELGRNEPPQNSPGEDAPEEPVNLPPLNPPDDTPPSLPPQACLREHLKLAGRLCKSELRCFAKGTSNPGTLRGCIANAEASFIGSSCTTAAWAGYVGASLSELDAAIRDGIDSTERQPRKLQVKLLKLAGKHCGKALAAESKNAKKPDAGKLRSKRSKARSQHVSKTSKAIAKAERKGFPYDGPAAGALADSVESIVDEVAGKPEPGFRNGLGRDWHSASHKAHGAERRGRRVPIAAGLR